MVMNRSGGLVGGPRVTAEEIDDAQFPPAFRGYDRSAVELFLRRVATEVGLLNRALADRATEQEELLKEISHLRQSGADPSVALPDEQRAVAILRMAQKNADVTIENARKDAGSIIGQARQQADQGIADARHQHDQIMQHAKQQADRILTAAKAQADAIVDDARTKATAERAAILDGATEESRREVDRYQKLGLDIRDGLRDTVTELYKQVSAWQQQAHEDAPEKAPAAKA